MIRRWMTGLLILLLAISVVGWIIYIPPAVLNTLRPVPAYAQIIYQNDSPDWSVLEKMKFSRDWKNAGQFFQTLEKKPLALAVAPLGGLDRRDTWVVVSVIGPRAVLLRWQLEFFPPAGVKATRSYGAWPVWEYDDPSLPAWMRVRFSIAEGLLICSLSDDSHDIYYLLDTLDGRRPSAEPKEMR